MHLIRANAFGANDNKFPCFVMFFEGQDSDSEVHAGFILSVCLTAEVNKLSVAKLVSCLTVYCLHSKLPCLLS